MQYFTKEFPFDVYLVGGAVRDQLLGIDSYDNDWVVVGATIDQMLKLGFRQVGADFPVFLHPKTHDEYALARSERKKTKGYKGFETSFLPTTTLEQDLIRRDFTINAIARDYSGAIIDPYNGKEDLDNRILRHVSQAFVEDPLRVLRGARFYAKFKPFGFEFDVKTKDLMQQLSASGELETLPQERIWQECEKAFETAHPEAFIEALRQASALKIILPEVDALFGVPQPKKYHPEGCAGTHTLIVLERVAALSHNNPVAAFAALCHDLGKGTTPKEMLPSHRGHELRSMHLTHELCDRLRVPNKYRDIAAKIAKLHMKAHQILEMRPTTLLDLLLDLDAYRKPDNLDLYLTVCEADIQGRGNPNAPFKGKERLTSAYSASRQINEGEIANAAKKAGIDISGAIKEARIAAIEQTL